MGPQGLHAHVRSAHAEHYKSFGVSPAPVSLGFRKPKRPTETAAIKIPDWPAALRELPALEVTPATPGAMAPLELLDTAIASLKARAEEIRVELERLTLLQQEQTVVAHKIDSLTGARKAFDNPPVS